MNEPTSVAERWELALRGLIAIYSALLLPLLAYLAVRMFYSFPMNYNEGWNAAYTSRLLAGEPLYVPLDRFPLTPLNYPPLSFAIVGALSLLTGNILMAGRFAGAASWAIVGFCIFRIVTNETGRKAAGVFAALFWLGLMKGLGGFRLVMNDPQPLAHAFSLSALAFFSERKEALTFRRAALLAALCCLALFIKHLVLVVPIVLAATWLVTDRRSLAKFAAAGVLGFAALAYASWRYAGDYFFSNFLDTARAIAAGQLRWRIEQIFRFNFAVVVFGPFALLSKDAKRTAPYLLYFALSLALAAAAARGVGVDINAWFEFFIAAAILFGIFASSPGRISWLGRSGGLRPGVAYAILLSALLPMLAAEKSRLPRALNYDALSRSESAYQRQVELLRSISGLALSEVLLLGSDAGKDFLLDPFSAAQLIRAGRIPENILTDAIREKRFGAIVFEHDPSAPMCGGPAPVRTIKDRWTEATLRAVNENYEPLERKAPAYYFYVPRRIAAGPGSLCPAEGISRR